MRASVTVCEYTEGESTFEGYLACPSTEERRPCILVGHAWDGPNAHFNAMADAFAAQGYLSFAIDVYGKGIRGRIDGDNGHLMNPLLADRALLRRRLLAALGFVQQHPRAMPDRVVMIGYCFGGLCALDLARAAPEGLIGAVAVHAPLAAPALPSERVTARLLVLHGWEDPVAPPSDVLQFAAEVTRAGARWELNAYGHAKHAFTFAGANIPELGIAYDAFAEGQSAKAIRAFMREVLGPSQ
jgi:dienelactone hydrolase